MTVSYTHRDDIPIEVSFVAETEATDYGVPGSPTWHEVRDDTVEVQTLEILGVDVDPAALPKDLLAAIMELSDEGEFG